MLTCWPNLLLTFSSSGEGAFAVVEQCAYTPGGAKGGFSLMVAVKKLKPGLVNREEDLASFMAEVGMSCQWQR